MKKVHITKWMEIHLDVQLDCEDEDEEQAELIDLGASVSCSVSEDVRILAFDWHTLTDSIDYKEIKP